MPNDISAIDTGSQMMQNGINHALEPMFSIGCMICAILFVMLIAVVYNQLRIMEMMKKHD